MALCMWLMSRGHAPAANHATEAHRAATSPADTATRQKVAGLRVGVTTLRIELPLTKDHKAPERGR
jgi:hypothetical protein